MSNGEIAAVVSSLAAILTVGLAAWRGIMSDRLSRHTLARDADGNILTSWKEFNLALRQELEASRREHREEIEELETRHGNNIAYLEHRHERQLEDLEARLQERENELDELRMLMNNFVRRTIERETGNADGWVVRTGEGQLGTKRRGVSPGGGNEGGTSHRGREGFHTDF